MNKKRLIIMIGFALASMAGLGLIVGAQDTNGTATAEGTESEYTIEDTVQAQRGDLQQSVTGTGVLDPARTVMLTFQTSAPVVDVSVTEGQVVEAGEVLARVESGALDERVSDAALNLALEEVTLDDLVGPARPEDIAVAEAAVEAARLSMGVGVALTGEGSIAAEIDQANAELQANILWQQQLNRDNNPPSLDGAWLAVVFTEEGSPERDAALEDYYLAEAQITLNENNLRELETGVQVAQMNADAENARPTTTGGSSSAAQQLTQAEINLENLLGDPDAVQLALAELDVAISELDLAYVQAIAEQALLVAPFDAVIAEINLDVGELPPANAMLLIDTSSFQLTVPVDEIDVSQLAIGQPVEIALDALPNADVTGVVEHIALTPTLLGDLTTYDVRILVDATDAPIRAGMTATASIITSDLTDAILIPSDFVLAAERIDADLVIVQNADGSLEPRRVTTGLETGVSTEVLAGVEAGDTLVLLSDNELQRLLRDLMSAGELNMGALLNGR